MDRSGSTDPVRVHRQMPDTLDRPAPSSKPLEHTVGPKGAKTTYHIHERNLPDSRLQQSLVGKHTNFAGEARVAQVLRWVSTAALQTQKVDSPEVQASVVGDRVMLGSNARDDSAVPAALSQMATSKKTMDARIGLLTTALADPKNKGAEKQRVLQQDVRHLRQLHAFTTNDKFYESFVNQSISELHQQMGREADYGPGNLKTAEGAQKVASVFKRYEDTAIQMKSMFGTIRESLKAGAAPSGPRIQMATSVKGQHAEQRIIETVQSNLDAEVEATRKARGKSTMPPIAPTPQRASSTATMPSVASDKSTPSRDFNADPNRRVDGWTHAAVYTVPQQSFDPKHPKRLAEQRRLAEYNNPTPKSPSDRVDFIAVGPGTDPSTSALSPMLIHTPSSLVPQTLTMPLAGTKPPCDMCEATEQARHTVATSTKAKNPLVVTRFEDNMHRVGTLFPGAYTNSQDTRVHAGLGSLLDNPGRGSRATASVRKRADSLPNFPVLPSSGKP